VRDLNTSVDNINVNTCAVILVVVSAIHGAVDLIESPRHVPLLISLFLVLRLHLYTIVLLNMLYARVVEKIRKCFRT
jgi:hypothetical protein